MGHGLEIYNDSNTIQINSELHSMVIDNSFSFLSGEERVGLDSMLYAAGPIVNGEPFDYRHKSKNGGIVIYPIKDIRETTIPTNGNGLEVFNIDGSVCYSSSKYPVKIIDHIKLDRFNGIDITKPLFTKIYTDVEKIAVISLKDGWSFKFHYHTYDNKWGEMDWGDTYQICPTITDNLLEITQNFKSWYNFGPGRFDFTWESEFLVLDITGL